MDDLTGSALKKFMEGTGASLRREMQKSNTPLPGPLALLLRRLAVAEVPPLGGEEIRGTSAKHQRIKLRNAPWPREARRYPLSESPAEAGALALSFDPARMRILQSGKNTEDWRGLRR